MLIVNFNQSSYAIKENDKMVTLEIVLSQPSPKSFQIEIDTMNVTAKGT